MGAIFSSSKNKGNKNASNNKLSHYQRPKVYANGQSSSEYFPRIDGTIYGIEEPAATQFFTQPVPHTYHSSRVPAMKEPALQVLNQRVLSTDHSSRVTAKIEPEKQAFTQSVPFTYSTPHSSRVRAMKEPAPQVFSQMASLTDHSRVTTKSEPQTQVLSQKVSLTDHSSRVPAMRESVPKVSNQKVPQTDHSSNVSEKKELEPQDLSNWLSSSVSSSRAPVSQTLNLNKMKKALPLNKNSKCNEDYILSIILDWNTEWLTEYSDSETPTQLSPFGEGTGIKTCYQSLEEYQSAYIPLILMETWAQMYSDFDEGKHFDFEGMRAPDNNYNKRNNFDNNFMRLNLHTVVAQNKIEDYPRSGQLVILEMSTEYGSFKKAFGYVRYFNSEEILENTKLVSGLPVPQTCIKPNLLKYVVLVSKSMETFPIREDRMINVKAFHYLRQTMRQIDLLSNLETSPLLKYILRPHRSVSEIVVSTDASLSCDKFNESQSEAILGISHVINSRYIVPKLVFIQGPPGTGKTFTLVETLKYIYMKWESDKSLPHILICAPSNGAVSEISRRIYKERDFLLNHPMKKYQRELRCVRVGNGSKILKEDRIVWLDKLVKDIVDQLMAEKRELEKQIKDLKKRIEKLDEEIISLITSSDIWEIHALTDTQKLKDNLKDKCRKLEAQNQQLKINTYQIKMDIMCKADIVLSTLNSSHSSPIEDLFERYGPKTFDCVIVDEASQCSEPEVLMPLVYKMSKMILIGDPKQLPATVISKKASSLNMGRSLFERFYEHFLECEQNNPNQKSPVLMLTEQFRMHPQICQFPSKQFYSGKLTTSSEVIKRNFNRLKPYILFDVSDTFEKSDSTKKSKLNLKEANFVIRLATIIDKKLNRSANNQKEYTLGVITPYNGQKTLLIDKFKCKSYKNIVIDVNTVDGFQGQERDVIIFSSVRAFRRDNKRKSIGFLDSVQRMNVALTRAKHSMILCISGHTLQRDNTWKSLIDDAIRRRNIRFKVSSNNRQFSDQVINNILAPIQ